MRKRDLNPRFSALEEDASTTRGCLLFRTISTIFKGRHGSDWFTKLLFESGYNFSVPLDVNVSVTVVGMRKCNRIRQFPCTVLHCPVV